MKKIALINDLSGFGRCSLTAAIPVISVMGIQACPLPTAVLTAQTGFPHFYCDDYTDKMDYFTEQWHKLQVSFDGIYSGYLADARQLEKVLHFLEIFRREDTLYLADPVMGDDGNTYPMYNEELLCGMRRLTGQADVITPNLTELCLLAGERYDTLSSYQKSSDYTKRIVELCHKLLERAERRQTIIVTGIVREEGAKRFVSNLAFSQQGEWVVETPYTPKSFSGTGDLFASVICGALVKGLSLPEALEKAALFLQAAIEEADREGVPCAHGVCFENYLGTLCEGL